MFMLNDKPLALDTPFTVGEGDEAIQYPANWLRLASLEEKQAIGITEVDDAPTYDDRYYWGVGNPKQLEDITVTPEAGESYVQKGLKSQWTAQVKDTAGKLLAATDWMVIRKAERDVAIPAETVAYRAAVVAECSRLETAIAGCSDVLALIAVVNSQDWPE